MNLLDHIFAGRFTPRSLPARRPATRRRTLAAIESLEDRQLLSTVNVTNVLDNTSAGSLRYAIGQVDAGKASTIDFKLSSKNGTPFPQGGGDYYVIKLSSPLPAITQPCTINGASQGGPAGVPVIEINGQSLSSSAVGLTVSAKNVEVKGVSLVGFGGGGIKVSAVSGASLVNDWIGLDPAENSIGNAKFGVEFTGGATNGSLTSSVVSATSNGPGVLITGASTAHILVAGNDIGTGANGTGSVSNHGDGVLVTSGASYNTIGGASTGQGNVNSGNSGNGIEFSGSGTRYNVVEQNIIGLDSSGETRLPNAANGVEIDSGASDNTIGGTSSSDRNVISGNTENGVLITDSGTLYNLVEGNYIGTSTSGLTAVDSYGQPIGNTQDGVLVQNNANDNVIGGSSSGAGNVISGNRQNGVSLNDAHDSLVAGNFIGTDKTGKVSLGSQVYGIIVHNSATFNTIGGTTSAAKNLISGNSSSGVVIGNSIGASDPGTAHNLVEGDDIGTDVSGMHAVPNGWDGVIIEDGATENTVGGTASGSRNIISGNSGNGVAINDSFHNLVEGNYIGVNSNGTGDTTGNHGSGVMIDNGAEYNTIGGTSTAARNIISANAGNGVSLLKASYTLVEGNDIGTDVSGKLELGNQGDGVYVDQYSTNNTIGGTVQGAGNLIANNDAAGVVLENGQNTVTGNNVHGNG